MSSKNCGKTDKKFIITGTFEAFLACCRERGLSPYTDAIFLTHADQVRGYILTQDNIIRFGASPVNSEIEHALFHCMGD